LDIAIFSSGSNAIITSLVTNSSEVLRLGQVQNATTTFSYFGINMTYLDSPATTLAQRTKHRLNGEVQQEQVTLFICNGLLI